MRMFDGFRSRWSTPRSWACCTAWANLTTNRQSSFGGKDGGAGPAGVGCEVIGQRAARDELHRQDAHAFDHPRSHRRARCGDDPARRRSPPPPETARRSCGRSAPRRARFSRRLRGPSFPDGRGRRRPCRRVPALPGACSRRSRPRRRRPARRRRETPRILRRAPPGSSQDKRRRARDDRRPEQDRRRVRRRKTAFMSQEAGSAVRGSLANRRLVRRGASISQGGDEKTDLIVHIVLVVHQLGDLRAQQGLVLFSKSMNGGAKGPRRSWPSARAARADSSVASAP